MSIQFPPRPDHADEVAKVAEAFGSVVEGRTALYVSSPLTTGKRLVDWRASTTATWSDGTHTEEFRRAVVEPNRSDAKVFVSTLREERSEVVIDPASLPDLEGWTQGDYRSLWGEVILRYVRLVVFRKGWEYSDGCAYEFLVAVQNRIATAFQDMAPMASNDGAKLIRRAEEQRAALGDSSEFAVAVLAVLESDGERPGHRR